jgi:isoleucyl-tRNA synthetase
MVAEEIYRGLTGERSVHLTDWPDAGELPADDRLVAVMDKVRDVCSSALSVRKARGLRVRLPLASLTVATDDPDALAPFTGIVADEVNVKDVRLTADVASVGGFVLQLVPAALGPRLGPETQRVIRAVKAGDWSAGDGGVVAGGVALEDGEYALRLVPVDEERSAPLSGNTGLVVVDTDVTPELEAEGQARDLVRAVQQARRDAGLDVSDRIRLVVRAGAPTVAALHPHEDFVAGEVLTVELGLEVDDALEPGAFTVELERS